jgi:hypothetical protein
MLLGSARSSQSCPDFLSRTIWISVQTRLNPAPCGVRQVAVKLEVNDQRHSLPEELHGVIVCICIFNEGCDSNGGIKTC